METGLADSLGSTLFPYLQGAFATPSPLPFMHLKVGFTPGWLSFHAPQLSAPPKPGWLHAGAKQAALGKEAAEPGLGVFLWAGGAQWEMNWSQVVWIDH